MASCNYSFDDDFMEQLNKLENTDEIVPKMLEAGAEIIVSKEQDELQAHKQSGSMIDSIKSTGVKENEYGHYLVVRPTGKDENGNRNMEKLVYLDYGTSSEAAHGIQAKVTSITADEVGEKAQSILEKEVGL